MAKEELRYDRMVEDALRSVVRRALIYVSEKDLPGNHHFYITFRTDHAGVDIPDTLKERYPGEMTIVLQHQFWGLEITDKDFSVTLSFADVPHRLTVPFASVTAFADPSVRFGLQFDVESLEGGNLPAGAEDPSAVLEAAQPGLGEPPAADKEAEAETGEAGETAAKEAEPDEADQAAEKIVTLDAFRKK